MIVEALSLVTSITNAVSAIFIAMGMRNSNPITANLVCTGVQTIALLSLIVFSVPELDWLAISIFSLSGVLALCIGRLLYFMGVEKNGVSVSSAIIGANPLISTLLAIFLINEEITTATMIGATLVVMGVYLLSEPRGDSLGARALMVPILSSFSYALSNVFRKIDLNIHSDPILGAQVAAISGTLSFGLYLVATGRSEELKLERRSLGYFSAAGIVASIGWVALMMATRLGKVSVVTTIVFSYPLFTLILSWFLLREQEKININIITGCVIIVIGVIIVSIF